MLKETDLPLEKEWETYFKASQTLHTLGLRRGMILADLGCGYGTFSIPAAQIVGNRGIVYAIDVDPKMVERVSERAHRIGLTNVIARTGDIIASPRKKPGIPARSVDLALLANIIHGTRKKVHLLKSVSRILRDNGSIAVINWKLERTPRGPPMKLRPTEDETGSYLINAGYVSPRVRYLPPYHYAVVGRLPTRTRRNTAQ
jgi:ubiquinone/menaquinone biosynthesis C-methylase UbiE